MKSVVFIVLVCSVTIITANKAQILQKSRTLSAEGHHEQGHHVYWTRHLNNELKQYNADSDIILEPKPLFTTKDRKNFIEKVHSETVAVINLEQGCGRPRNLLATFSDGTKACCRYREHQWKEIRGDFYSYHMNNLLGLWNTPPTVLTKVEFSSKQWEQVAELAKKAGWKDHATISMSIFIEDLKAEFIPPLLKDTKSNATLTRTSLEEASLNQYERLRLMEWTDMIIFDFVIGHTDRIFNTLLNLQWNPSMMDLQVHNLKKTADGDLLLLDNESGFWMGYAIGKQDPPKYDVQEKFLKKICLFRHQTIESIEALLHYSDTNVKMGSSGIRPDLQLERYIQSVDPDSYMLLETLDRAQKLELKSRLQSVLEQVRQCAKK